MSAAPAPAPNGRQDPTLSLTTRLKLWDSKLESKQQEVDEAIEGSRSAVNGFKKACSPDSNTRLSIKVLSESDLELESEDTDQVPVQDKADRGVA